MAQVDRINGLLGNLGMKTPVCCMTTGPITLSGQQTVDGVALLQPSPTNAQRVLVAHQSDATTNGIYLCQGLAWTREPDFDGPQDIVQGSQVFVTGGTANSGTLWKVTTPDPIVIDTSNITFGQIFTSDPTTIISAPNKATPVNADKFSIVDSVTAVLATLTFANLVTSLSALCSAGWNAYTATNATNATNAANAAALSSFTGTDARYAQLAGLSTQQFSVADATAASQAVAFDQAFGLGQTYKIVTRNNNVTYYNTTGRPILTGNYCTTSSSNVATIYVNGIEVYNWQMGSGTGGAISLVLVPPGSSYVLSGYSSGASAVELS
jgi:hypothetical protein